MQYSTLSTFNILLVRLILIVFSKKKDLILKSLDEFGESRIPPDGGDQKELHIL